MSEPILTVVEELKGIQLRHFSRMYDPDFWLPYIPLKNKKIELKGDKIFAFEVGDRVSLDPLNTIVKDFTAKGTMNVKEMGKQGDKGNLWEITAEIMDPQVNIEVRLRAKDLPNALKIGIFLTKLEFDLGLLDGLGKDAILFAARVKIRDMLQELQKKLK
jgi:hypothetical protein